MWKGVVTPQEIARDRARSREVARGRRLVEALAQVRRRLLRRLELPRVLLPQLLLPRGGVGEVAQPRLQLRLRVLHRPFLGEGLLHQLLQLALLARQPVDDRLELALLALGGRQLRLHLAGEIASRGGERRREDGRAAAQSGEIEGEVDGRRRRGRGEAAARLHLAGLVAGDVEQAGLVRDLALRHGQLRL